MLKGGVKLRGITPPMLLGHSVVAEVFSELGYQWVVTSCNDSRHGRGSLHFSGNALDYRLRHLPVEHRAQVADTAKRNLGAEFDVLHESRGTDNEHLHVEYQPKVT